ncbi:Metallo-dependent phosphatase-like protein [Chytriomyces sp. MP71]|nr:Metallo-dependent phosphatase-like protein [Chytriomyces sp. MP71]
MDSEPSNANRQPACASTREVMIAPERLCEPREAFSTTPIADPSTQQESEPHLRIVTINDVYQLDFLPRLATAIAVERAAMPEATFIVTLPGDFLAPSLLSSLDKGFGMVDMLNQIGVDFVCLGNHEDDVDFAALQNRIMQSNFVWVNTNMPDLPLCNDAKRKTSNYSIGNVGAKRVALLGLCTEDEQLYKPNRFGGANILPVNETALKFARNSQAEGFDLIIALTHQELDRDRKLAQTQVFPLILGGHEHTPFLEEHGNCHIVKTGMDASKFAVVDINWNAKPTSLSIQVVMKDTSTFAPDVSASQLLLKHKRTIERLKDCVLFHIPGHITLSSKDIRRGQATLGTFLTTVLRNATNADCCLLTSGTIRGNNSYKGAKVFTYFDLQNEIPFPTEIVTLDLPGWVLNEMVKFSRAPSLQNPPVEKGGFFQVCDQVKWDAKCNEVVEIGGVPLKFDQMYRVTTYQKIMTGIDDIKPLMEYLQSTGRDPSCLPSHRDYIGAKEMIVSYFSKALWHDLLVGERFEDLDKAHAGFVTKDDLLAEMTKHFEGDVKLSNAAFDNVFSVADLDGDGKITADEFLHMKQFLNQVRFGDQHAD